MRIGATSFVYPAGWLHNAERLAPEADDIELLMFAGSAELPDADEIEGLRRVKMQHGLSYSVHMPLGIGLASAEQTRRAAAVTEVLEVARRLSCLEPWGYVLHVYHGEGERDPHPPADLSAWRGRAHDSLSALCRGGLAPQQLCVEWLDYDLELLAPVLDDIGVSVALDVGHLCRDGRALRRTVESFLPRSRALHWHGVDPSGRDHRGLDHFDPDDARWLIDTLGRARYDGVVTLEVFRPEDWAASLRLARRWIGESEHG